MSTTVNVHDEKKRNNETDNQHCLSGLKYLLCLSIGLFVEQKCNIVNYCLFVCVSHCVYNQKYKLINYLSVSPPVFPSLTLWPFLLSLVCYWENDDQPYRPTDIQANRREILMSLMLAWYLSVNGRAPWWYTTPLVPFTMKIVHWLNINYCALLPFSGLALITENFLGIRVEERWRAEARTRARTCFIAVAIWGNRSGSSDEACADPYRGPGRHFADNCSWSSSTRSFPCNGRVS